MQANNTPKVVVITGAANGLGKALAFEFFKQGFHLALIDIDIAGLRQLEKQLSASLQKVSIHHADISSEQNIQSARADILEAHQNIDILINNAGISISAGFEQTSLDDHKRVFDTNFWGTVCCSKYFLPDLRQQFNSRLVNIISGFAYMGFPGKTAYVSSKAGVAGFTYALKTELADSNVTVSLVIPPPLDTELVRKSKHISEEKRNNEASFLKKNGMPINIAAKKIVKQIIKGKFRIIIGAKMYWIDLASRLFPTQLHKVISANKSRIDFI